MVLTFEDFIIFTANWQDKATNIKKMSKELSLGLDSFVFLDDNPIEREWVKSNLPDVIVPDCGDNPWEMLAALRRGMYFESIRVTTEDRSRYDDYKQNMNRRKFEENASLENISRTEFLKSLNMISNCGSFDEAVLPRVTQLINKTNQFNLTTRRYSEEQIKKMYESTDTYFTRRYRLKDKFGDQGIVGIIIANKNEKIWHIDSWLISCRVLGRQLEEFMFEDLLTCAKAEGISYIYGEYIPTPKNDIAKDLYKGLGFTYDEASGHYIFNIDSTSKTELGVIQKELD
jgi:FkbH-like protein